MKNEKIKIMVLRPQARLGLAPQRRFGAQPPKAALGAEMRNRAARPGSWRGEVRGCAAQKTDTLPFWGGL